MIWRMLLFIALASCASAQVDSFKYDITEDGHMSNGFNNETNYGTATSLSIGEAFSGGVIYRTIVAAAFTDSITDGDQIDSVHLVMYQSTGSDGFQVDLYQLMRFYYEANMTWNDWYKTDSEWTTSGATNTGSSCSHGDASGADISTTVIGTYTIASADNGSYVIMSMTDMTYWNSCSDSTFKVFAKYNDESPGGTNVSSFYSSDQGTNPPYFMVYTSTPATATGPVDWVQGPSRGNVQSTQRSKVQSP